jgi:hypothetical protein
MINDYKMVHNHICDLYLQLMLIWMKMKIKNTFISSIFLMASQNKWKCSFCDLEGDL